MRKTGRTWFKAESTRTIGMHWLVTPSEQYISRYPPGLAVMIAGVYKAFGYKASMLVNPVLSVLALIAMFMLARRLVATGWALAATALLAFNPHFVHHALSGDSHMGVTCFLTWASYFLVCWSQEPKLSLALLAGIFFGVVPTIRYPDSIMAMGVGVFLLLHVSRVPGVWKHYLVFVARSSRPCHFSSAINFAAGPRSGVNRIRSTNEQTGF